MVETWSSYRFCILERGTLNGYIERIDDVPDSPTPAPAPALGFAGPAVTVPMRGHCNRCAWFAYSLFHAHTRLMRIFTYHLFRNFSASASASSSSYSYTRQWNGLRTGGRGAAWNLSLSFTTYGILHGPCTGSQSCILRRRPIAFMKRSVIRNHKKFWRFSRCRLFIKYKSAVASHPLILEVKLAVIQWQFDCSRLSSEAERDVLIN
jgi:hypothetical protein